MKVDTSRIGEPVFLMVLTGGKFACQRNDGVMVVPVACLRTGREIDLIIEKQPDRIPVEIKSGKTVQPDFFKNVRYWLKLSGEKQGKIIYAGDSNQKRSEGIDVISWKNLI